ncbi:hypothetical protein V5O48_001585 [Marasmius crinis-equi]|uniref:JmjC domain-containing protein n=1 Tax=Marasmius crinis-equi TaxID=585013 RepID=A0ABR3FY08_9AGAR
MTTSGPYSTLDWPSQVIVGITEQLQQKSDPVTAQLFGCGEDNYRLLLSVARDLVAGASLSGSCEVLKALADVSYAKMSRGESQICWRRLYTDAHILRSMAGIDGNTALEAIGHLDRAIIIAGAAGDGRLDLILSLISKIQSSYVQALHLPTTSAYARSNQLPREPLQIKTSRHPIPCMERSPSLQTFQTSSYKYPFVLRRFASDWPAINEHPWSSTAYLRSVAGPGRLVPVEVGADYRADDWTQKLMSWNEFLASLDLEDQTGVSRKEVLYLAQHNLLMQFRDLNADIIVPDYAYTSLPPPSDFPGYKPPGNEDQLVINAWLGPQGTISPAHTDPYYNLFVQAVGRKTVWVTSPELSKYMYPYTAQHSENPATNANSTSMDNTSHVDVFCDESGGDRYPEFWKHVVEHKFTMHATLEPGDLLFLPPGWWHAMRAEETSFSVSMWF